MDRYRVQVMDENDRIVAETPANISTLDSVIVLQLCEGVFITHEQEERLMDELMRCFPERNTLLLPSAVRFVRLIQES